MAARWLAALVSVAVVAAGAAGPAPASASQPAPGADRDCARAVLPEPVAGDEAADQLAADPGDLAAAADVNDTSPAALLRELSADDTAWVDGCGRQFYVEPPAGTGPADGATAAGATVPAAGAYPYSETFALHSRPGSQRVIYLDFTGFRVAGTAWNANYHPDPFDAAAFDTDGNPAAFSAAEQDIVQYVWQVVAEDFAPFDVDVTTADPGQAAIARTDAADAAFGTRVVITPDRAWYGCSCGGVAYLNVFDALGTTHDRYQPAFVFSSALSNNAKYLAEAASHEAGHNFGLAHDGVAGGTNYYAGHGAWAPIMGVGYSRPVSQWSRGEYTGANNTENDLALIAAGGAPLRADDHAGAPAGATALNVVDGSATATGVITTAADADYFHFAAATDTTAAVVVTPAATGPNLDLAVTVYDAAGRQVAADNPLSAVSTYRTATGLAATLHLPALLAGGYYVRVDGAGAGSPASTGYSDYASLGRYTLTVTGEAVDAPAVTVVSTSVPRATRGGAYRTALTARGGTGRYTWSVAGGRLPAGLALSTGGAITGRPTAHGRTAVTVAATDTAGRRATRTLAVGVAAVPRISTGKLPKAKRGKAYRKRLAVVGGNAAYRWSRVSGKLPRGLRLSSAGTISGKPRARGRFTVKVAVTDKWGVRGYRTLRLTVR